MSKQLYFKQCNLVLFLPIDRTLSGVTTPGQSGSGSDGNERVFCIPQSSTINGTSASDCLVSYPKHIESVLLLRRDAVNLCYSPSWLGNSRIFRNYNCLIIVKMQYYHLNMLLRMLCYTTYITIKRYAHGKSGEDPTCQSFH